MRILITAAIAGTLGFAAPAFAWSETMTQPASNDMPIWAYKSNANYCPTGLQPVVVGGVICCGTPNRSGYYPQPTVQRRVKRQKTYVSYGKGYNDSVVVYEKGQ